MSRRPIYKLFKKHVRHTHKNAPIELAHAEVEKISLVCLEKAFISTWTLKHIYDKRPAQEFDFLMRNVGLILRDPDQIYKNKHRKSGDFCFVKNFLHNQYVCIVQQNLGRAEIVTFFRANEGYFDDYELLWERRTAEPHRNVFNIDTSCAES
jgi:hypothetical protein